MKRTLLFIFLSVSITVCTQELVAQQSLHSILTTVDTATTYVSPESTVFVPRAKKSGTLALLLSAVVPGAGQLYAERYFTIPIIWGCGAFFYSQYRVADGYYRDFKQRYEQSVRLDTINQRGNLYYKETRDYYHDKRDEFAIYLALTYVLNIVDAYVGATLYDFDISPQLDGVTVRYSIRLR